MKNIEKIKDILRIYDLEDGQIQEISSSIVELNIYEKDSITAVVELIEDSIDRFSDIDKENEIDYIEIRPVLDGINLLLEKNTAIKIVDSNNNEISTYKCLEEGLNKTNYTEIKISNNFKFQISLIDGEPKKLNSSEESIITNLFKELKKRKLINNIEKAIKYNSDKETSEKKINFSEYNFEDFKNEKLKEKIIEKLRKLISDSLKLVQNNESIKIKGLDTPNVFSVVRYASDKRKDFNLNYTAQILLSKNQLEQLSKKFILKKDCEANESKTNALKRILEDPLDGESTSEADNCFKHENVRFDIFSESEKAKTETDKKRAEIETKLYNFINSNEEKPLVYIPIHLNGAAWMAIYRIRTEKDIDYMSFYRNKISYIGNQIRTRAYESFFWMYRNEMESIFSKNTDEQLSIKIDRINTFGMALSCFFPYYIPQFPSLTTNYSINEYLNIVGNEDYNFQFKMNIIWANQIDYDNLPIGKYEKRIKRHINRINAEMLKELNYVKVIEASYSVAHLLKNKLGSSLKALGEIEIRIKDFIRVHYKKQEDIDRVYNKEFKIKIDSFEKSNRNNTKLLSIMDIVPKSYSITTNNNHRDIFLIKENKFNTELNIDIKKIIASVAKDLNISNYIKYEISELFIKTFIFDSTRNIYVNPISDFYEICVLEVLTNYYKYNHNNSTLIIDVINNNTNILIFRNQCDDDEELKPKFQDVSSAFGFLGAISYIYNAYKKTGVGTIKYRVIENQGKKYFELGLFLESLKFTKYEKN